jgi:hypothetical protein
MQPRGVAFTVYVLECTDALDVYIYTPYSYVHICVCIGRDREIYTQYIKKNVALQV